jgi:hypothetical protein
MADYLATLAGTLGISIWLLLVMLVWSMAWKLMALWKSARKSSLIWFIVLAIFNTLGILPILYIFVFSKIKVKSVKQKKVTKKKSKKKK